MTKKKINPDQVEDVTILSETPTEQVLTDLTEQKVEIEFDAENISQDEPHKVIETSRFIESEILYETNNPNRSSWDLTDALIDIETIYSVERILDNDRFHDFGCDNPSEHELHPEDCCVVFTHGYPLGIIMVDMSYEDLTKILIAYRG